MIDKKFKVLLLKFARILCVIIELHSMIPTGIIVFIGLALLVLYINAIVRLVLLSLRA